MKYKTLFWDLDGTLTDSGPGIMKSAAYALDKLGIEHDAWEKMRYFVGPPLVVSFGKFGLAGEKNDEAIRLYRERYHETGMWENEPYPGIEELLQKCVDAGFHMYVATSKPEKLSKEIIAKFGLNKYFDEVAGATMGHERETKEDVLRYLMDQIQEKDSIVMIGDTIYDVEGANKVGLPTIGVRWGYGIEEDMVQAGVKKMVDTMDELYGYLMGK